MFYKGGELTYSFPFSYLQKKFVKVKILSKEGVATYKEYGRDYTVEDKRVLLTVASTTDDTICIYRQTPTDRQVEFVDASILKAYDLNKFEIQLLHIAEENYDSISNDIIHVNDANNTWEGLFRRISNVANPQEAQDVVTKSYFESVQVGYLSANNALKDEATRQAGIATSQQQEATKQANIAATKQQEASASASAASTSASDSATSAYNARASETNASNSADRALSSATVATTQANSALISANNAKQSETTIKTWENVAKKWAVDTATPDNNSDTQSTTGLTQSARSWALYAKAQAQNAAADSARVQAMTLTNIDSIVENGSYVVPSPNPDDAEITNGEINNIVT